MFISYGLSLIAIPREPLATSSSTTSGQLPSFFNDLVSSAVNPGKASAFFFELCWKGVSDLFDRGEESAVRAIHAIQHYYTPRRRSSSSNLAQAEPFEGQRRTHNTPPQADLVGLQCKRCGRIFFEFCFGFLETIKSERVIE